LEGLPPFCTLICDSANTVPPTLWPHAGSGLAKGEFDMWHSTAKVDIMTEVIKLLRDMVAIPSVSCGVYGKPDDIHGESRMVQFIADFFEQHHIDYDIQQVKPGHDNVIARVKGSDGPSLLLEAHTDTVEVENMDIDPFNPVMKDGRLYGRGACDDKASVAAILIGVKNAAEKGLPGEVTMAASADEECSFGGARKLIESGFRANGAVVGEPTQLELVVAHKGACRVKVFTHGKLAHSSEPHRGYNAIYSMAQVISALRDYAESLDERPRHPLVGRPTCSVGTIRGGQATNVVPDLCEITVDRRMVPGEDTEQTVAEIQHSIASRIDDTVKWHTELLLGDYPLETDPECWVAKQAQAAIETVTGGSTLKGVHYGTDASNFAQAGIPSVVVGPGSIQQAHSAVEYVEIEQVEKAVQIYERICLAQ